jgi:hypothetical protein
VREQEKLGNSALTAGKQLKRVAPLRAKTTSSRGLLQAALHRSPEETEVRVRRSSPRGVRMQNRSAIVDKYDALEAEARFIGCTLPTITLCACAHLTPRRLADV